MRAARTGLCRADDRIASSAASIRHACSSVHAVASPDDSLSPPRGRIRPLVIVPRMTRTDGRRRRHPPLGASWDGSRHHLQGLLRPRDLDRAGARRRPGPPASDGAGCRRDLAPAEQRWRVPGTRYGFRAYGPVESGCRSPVQSRQAAARSLCARHRWSQCGGTRVSASRDHAGAHGPLHPDPADSAAHLPRSVVVADDFDWQGDRRPEVPWSDSVIYECHVKGMTALHPAVPAGIAGHLARPRLRIRWSSTSRAWASRR